MYETIHTVVLVLNTKYSTYGYKQNGPADQVYFYESNPKKKVSLAACATHARQSFPFQKITGTSKINILQIPSFNINEQSPKRKFEI